MKTLYLIIILITPSILGCEKIGKKVENYDLFGLDQAQEGIQASQEKIKAAQEVQKQSGHKVTPHQGDTSILGNN